jgi:sporulation protein YlmC with PRC-barrel domain
MTERRRLDLALTVLDAQVVDRHGRRCGRVDDIELEGDAGEALRLTALIVGPGAFAARMRGGLAGRLVSRLLGGSTVSVPWSDVERISHVVRLQKRADELGLGTADARLASWLERIPLG